MEVSNNPQTTIISPSASLSLQRPQRAGTQYSAARGIFLDVFGCWIKSGFRKRGREDAWENSREDAREGGV